MDDRDYDLMDDGSDEMNEYALRKIAYPPRLMVDFTSIGVHALQRYARFYNIKVDDECDKEDLAALVARHFDGSLEVEEHESISSFIQRVRNGERSSSKRSLDKDRRAAADKKRKKSNSRKRQRDVSVSVGAGGNPSSNSSGHGGHHGSSANGHGGSSSGAANSGTHHHHAGSSASSSHHEKTTGSSSAGNATASGKGAGKRGSKKKDDNEDNELYCICNLPSYGNMIACDGKKCPNPSQWYHLECVGLADGRHPDTWLCPECDPKGFAAFQSKKKKTKHRSKSPGAK